MVAASEERAQVSGGDVGVGGDQSRHQSAGYRDVEPAACDQPLDGIAAHVGDEVAEPIDDFDGAFEPVGVLNRPLATPGGPGRPRCAPWW